MKYLTSKAAAVGALVLVMFTSGCDRQPATADDCILKFATAGRTESAVAAAASTCRRKFANTDKQLDRELTLDERALITGRGSAEGTFFTGQVHTGTGLRLTRIVIELQVDSKDEQKPRRRYEIVREIEPLSAAELAVKVVNEPWLPEWSIVEARGRPL